MPTALHLQLALYTAVLPGLIAVVLLLEHEIRLWLRGRDASSKTGANSAPAPLSSPVAQDFTALVRALRSESAPTGAFSTSRPSLPAPSLNAALAIGLAVMVAFLCLDGIPSFPLRGTQVVAFAILGGGLLGLSLAHRPSFLAAIARPQPDAGSPPSATPSAPAPGIAALLPRAGVIALLGGGILLAQVLRKIPAGWETETWVVFSLILLLWIALVILMDLAASTPSACGWWVPLLFTISLAMAAPILALVANVAIYAQLAAAAATACGVALLAGAWRRSFLFGPGGSFASMLTLATLALNGYLYGYSFPLYAALLMAAAPGGLVLILLPRMQGVGRWAALLLAIALPGIALALFLLNQAPDNAYGY
jgi:hypothetical protein